MFGETNAFTMFSPQHGLPLVVILLCIILTYVFRHQLRSTTRQFPLWLGILSIVLIANEALLYFWYFYSDTFALDESLPMQLCGISYLLTIVMLLRPSYRLYEFLYFAGIGGALQALLTPAAILSGFPHFTYFYFFIGHGAIVWAALYMTWVYGYRPTWGSMFRALAWLNALLAIIIPLNLATGGNYFFISEKPAGGTMLDFLGPWPWYILSMEAIAIVVFVLLYIPFAWKRKPLSQSP